MNNDEKAAPLSDLSGQPASEPGADEPPAPESGNGIGDPDQVDNDLEDKRMSLLEHLQELRTRLRNAGIAFVGATILSFVFVKTFFRVLVTPTLKGIEEATGKVATIQQLDPTEAFWVMMKLAMVGGFLVAAPFVFWELWKFIAPGLYRKEKRVALLITGATAGCFIIGALFGYFVISKPAAYFLTQMALEFAEGQDFKIVSEWRLETLFNYLVLTLAGCGVAFELPVVLVVLGALGIITARGLWKFNKYALILSAVAGAVLTPSTDVVTQLLLSGPLYALYNISIIFVWLIERARKRKNDALEAEAASS